MDRIDSQVNRALRPDEIVHADATLGREVPHAGSTIDGRRTQNVRREFVSGIDQAAGTLKPWMNAARVGEEIPAQDYRSQTYTTERATADRQDAAYGLSTWIDASVKLIVRRRRIGLPQGHDVATKLNLTAQNSGMKHWGQGLASLKTGPEELVVRSIAYPRAPVDERAVFPAHSISNLRHRVGSATVG